MKKFKILLTAFGKKYDGKAPDAFNALGYDTVYFLRMRLNVLDQLTQ